MNIMMKQIKLIQTWNNGYNHKNHNGNGICNGNSNGNGNGEWNEFQIKMEI